MSGNTIGGVKTAKTNIKRYGQDYYKRIGAMGGKISRGGGFASNIVGADGLTGAERARKAGAKGGRKSRKNK